MDRVILGTVAYQSPELVKQACKIYPAKIAVGIDVKNGQVATHGWKASHALGAVDFSKQFGDMGVGCIVYTDIQRDGMLSGLNFQGISDFVSQTDIPIIAAGGLRDLEDVKRLAEIRSSKILGAVTGKAIYEGTLDLKEALRVAGSM